MTRVGLYLDLRHPPGSPGSFEAVYAQALDRVATAEARGLDAVWLTEHHGFADGYLPAPLTAAAAVAARTSRVRIGTAVVVGPLLHPAMLAEQAAVVDVISGGRLELGVGAGWREEEFTRIGADFRGRYTALEDGLRALPELWASGAATPPPVQQPLPTWVGARGPRGARIAGRVGAGLLWLDPALLGPYREGLVSGGHDADDARLGGLVNVFLADDPESAREQLRAAGRRNRSSYRGNTGAARSGGGEGSGDGSGGTGGGKGSATFPTLQVLTGAQAVDRVRAQVEGLPVTDVFCFADLGGLPDDLVDRHLELVCDVLRPGLAGSSAIPADGRARRIP